MVMMSISAFAEAPMQSTDMKDVTWFDRFISFLTGGTFSTSRAADLFYVEPDSYMDLTFYTNCEESGLYHDFYIDFGLRDSGSLFGNSENAFRYSKECTAGETFKVTLNNIHIPKSLDKYCQDYITMYIKHVRYQQVYGPVQLDPVYNFIPSSSSTSATYDYVDTYGQAIDGFEPIIFLNIECESDICEGLTGNIVKADYCDNFNNQVRRDVYTEYVVSGECYVDYEIVDQCGDLGCSNSKCVTLKQCYLFDDNKCTYVNYKSTETIKNCYSTMIQCQQYIVETTVNIDSTVDTTDVVSGDQSEDVMSSDTTTQDASTGDVQDQSSGDVVVDYSDSTVGGEQNVVNTITSILPGDSASEKTTNGIMLIIGVIVIFIIGILTVFANRK